MQRPRLVYVVTHPISADLLLRGQLTFMREKGFDVSVIAAPGEALERVRAREKGVECIGLPMARDIDPRSDAVALAKLTRLLRRLAPDIVNAGTTKGGLLGMIAARAANVPVRVYLLRGLRLEALRGLKRKILTATEVIASACAHDVVCVSKSLERLAIDGNYIPRKKLLVVGEGSSNGVDVDRFRWTEAIAAEGRRRTKALGIPDDAPIVGFVGRLTHEKGIDELLDAFDRVRIAAPNAWLLLVGGDLGDQDAAPHLVERVKKASNVVAMGSTNEMPIYYAAMRVLVLPSFREGFPNVVLEASAMSIPTVGFHTTGVVDAIEDGVTGALVPQGDSAALAEKVVPYVLDEAAAKKTGAAARARVERKFSNQAVWTAWLAYYEAKLRARGLPLPSPS